MTEWTWGSRFPAPAKLNLFLHVTGRRSDGYHTLQSVFRFIDWADSLRFTPRADGQVVLASPLPGVPDEQHLCVRAARALQAAGGCGGVSIALDKKLPMGGGVGGGSSDAATTLLALNHLWRVGLSRQELMRMGLSLGADVPVFVFGRSAFAEGVGELLQEIELPAAWYLVLVPPVAVPTSAIFGAADLPRQTPPMRAADWRPGLGHNDLQGVACRVAPVVAEHLEWLGQHAEARMTGSGACVFASFANRADAESVAARMPSGMVGWVTEGLAAHPLLGLAV